jgi:hypothetical protein
MESIGVARFKEQCPAPTMLKCETRPTPLRLAALGCFAILVPLLIPMEQFIAGGVFLVAALLLVLRDPDPSYRRRMLVLLGCIVALAIAPIRTDTSNRGFLHLGSFFAMVIVVPALILGRTDPGVIRYRIWPRRFRKLDVFYVAISIPLAWAILKLYWHLTPDMPTHWTLPAIQDPEETWRLFTGINCVGIWDELFFVNTVYLILRSIFPFRLANAGQVVVYTSVLYDMAFTGAGLIIVPIFAWTQGSMFEESENLLYVLVVHLIVDFFLFTAIVLHYYPGFSLGWH